MAAIGEETEGEAREAMVLRADLDGPERAGMTLAQSWARTGLELGLELG